VGSVMTRQFYLRERVASIHWTGGWVTLRVGLDAMEKRKI
jgi:hypothetical protein